jgi:hypothetical protein
MSMEQEQQACTGPLERSVSALDPERAAFEAAMAKRGYHLPPALYRDGTYHDTCYSAGWDAWQAAICAERKAWMDAVTDEPELPGAMPDAMWDVLRSDRDASAEALRIVVRQTKAGILKRGMRSNVRANRDTEAR